MASRARGRLSATYLPSDPNFLLGYMTGLPSDESDDDFDGYISDTSLHGDDEPQGLYNYDCTYCYVNTKIILVIVITNICRNATEDKKYKL